jgi:hypothetical protein
VILHSTPKKGGESFVQHFVRKKKEFRLAVAFFHNAPLVRTVDGLEFLSCPMSHGGLSFADNGSTGPWGRIRILDYEARTAPT